MLGGRGEEEKLLSPQNPFDAISSVSDW